MLVGGLGSLLMLIAVINVVTADASDDSAADRALSAAKKVCELYTKGFISPETTLLYGKRINGPKGTMGRALGWVTALIRDKRTPRDAGFLRPTAGLQRTFETGYDVQCVIHTIAAC
jgi:hypothetical protein